MSPAPLQSQVLTLDNYDPNVEDAKKSLDVRVYVNSIAVVPGQKILAGGTFTTLGTQSAPNCMARLYAHTFPSWNTELVKSGAWDYGFYPYPQGPGTVDGYGDYVWQIAAHQNHGVVVSGTFNSIGGAAKVRCARLELANGSAQPFLPPRMKRGDQAILPQQISQLRGGDILIWGDFTGGDSIPPQSYPVDRVGLFRWNMFSGHYDLGLLDPNYNAYLEPTSDANIWAVNNVLVQDDNKIVISGNYDRVNGVSTNRLVRLNDDASTDPTFTGPSIIPNSFFVVGMLAQPDGKILVNMGNEIHRLNNNGSVDGSFVSPFVTGSISSMLLQQDGKIIVSGGFSEINGVARSNVARLDSTGAVDPSFNAITTNGAVYAVALQDNGNIVIGGEFTIVNGVTRRRLARLVPAVPATHTLTVDPEGTFIRWNRSGTSAELHNVDFEVSLNDVSYTTLGLGQVTATGWEKTGLAAATLLPGNKKFFVRVSGNSSGGSRNYSEGLLEDKASYLRPAPRIATQPVGLTKNQGESAVFTVVPSAVLPTATAPTIVLPYSTPSYQWRKGTVPLVDGPNISGAQTPTLTINSVTGADAVSYNVVITNSAGSITSASALLKVILPPIISVEPLSQNIGLNKSVSFSVKLSQGTTPAYVWQFNGSTTMPAGVTGALTSKLTISKAQLFHEGTFKVTVSNSAGNDVSADATLNVIDVLPGIVPVANQLVALGTPNVTFAPAVTSEVTPTFVWLKTAKVVAGATTDTLVIPTAAITDAGSYQLKATNPLGLTTSTAMELAVVDTANRRVMGKLNASTVIAPPISGKFLTYKWYKVGVVGQLTDGVDYSGTATAKLTVKTTTAADEGQYFCEVTLVGAAAPLNTGNYDLYVASKPVFTAATALPGGKVSDATYSHLFADYDTDPNLTPTSFTASSLPPGLTMNKTTGLISGRPTTAGIYNKIKITLSNIAGSVVTLPGVYSITIDKLNDSVVGTYVGLINRAGSSTIPVAVPTTAIGPLHALGARLDLTTSPNGIYSGKVTVGTKAYSFVNSILDNSVSPARGTVLAISRGTGKTTLKLEFELDAGTNLLSGTLVENALGAVPATVSGWRKTWKTTGTPLSPANPATTRVGNYHNFKAVDPGMVADAALPEGASYGAVKIDAAGTATVSGRTADDFSITTSAPLGPMGQVLVYTSLYAGTGSFTGSLAVADDTAHKLTGALTWSRAEQKSGRRYKAGWPTAPISLTATGGLYKPVTSTTSSTTVMSLATLPALSATLNAQLDFEGGGVGGNAPAPGTLNSTTDPAIVFQIFSLATVKMPVSPGNPATVKLTVTNSSGAFSGSFILTDSPSPKRTINYKGVIVPDPDTVNEFDGEGVGLYIANGLLPTTSTSPERSGMVNLKASP